jgi:hypothetical protein
MTTMFSKVILQTLESTLFKNLSHHKITKITISKQSLKSYRKYKSENGCTRISEYIRGGIMYHRGVNIPC